MAANQFTITIEDIEEKLGTTTINPGGLTAANFTAKRAALDTLKTAIAAVTLGEVRRTTFSEIIPQSAAAVTDPFARRGNKWLVTMRDDQAELAVGVTNPGYLNLFEVTIAAADNALATEEDETMDLTAGAGLALKNALEATAESPTGGAANTVLRVKQVNHKG